MEEQVGGTDCSCHVRIPITTPAARSTFRTPSFSAQLTIADWMWLDTPSFWRREHSGSCPRCWFSAQSTMPCTLMKLQLYTKPSACLKRCSIFGIHARINLRFVQAGRAVQV